MFLYRLNEKDTVEFTPHFGNDPKVQEILDKYRDRNITIPMLPLGRSINLANSASIILYEALRQNNFEF